MLSEVSQLEKDKHYMASFIWREKNSKGNKGERRKNEWNILGMETENVSLLTLEKEQGVVEREVGTEGGT